jgi:hypothetical protein
MAKYSSGTAVGLGLVVGRVDELFESNSASYEPSPSKSQLESVRRFRRV